MTERIDEHEIAARLLDAIIDEFAQRGVRPTALNLLAAVTDGGAEDDLAAAVATIFQQRRRELCHDLETC